jgi:DNA (cytosine-5)-methyltransferase 1
MENVPSLQTKYKGKLFQRILDLTDDLGYTPTFSILNAVAYGVPQVRRRLFVVGTRPGLKFQFPNPRFRLEETAEQTSLFESDTGELSPPRTVHDAIADLPSIKDGERAGHLPYSQSEGLTEYQRQMRNGRQTVGNNICRVSNERAKKVFSHMRPGSKYMDLPAEVRRILPFREDIFYDRLKRLDMSKPSWTILAHIGMDGYMYIHPTADRTLSVREAARVQSFRDGYEFVGNMREQYVQVGNAVPPILATAIAQKVKETIQ